MATDASRIVIVGGGQAGGWAAKTLRDNGFAGTLTLVADEPHPPYERPPLSKAVLAGTAAPEQTHLFKGDLFAGLGVDWRRGRRALTLDRALVSPATGTCMCVRRPCSRSILISIRSLPAFCAKIVPRESCCWRAIRAAYSRRCASDSPSRWEATSNA